MLGLFSNQKYRAMKKIFNLASFPPRYNSLQETIASILPQADEIHVYLNLYNEVPEFLNHPKITAYLGKDQYGDIGDVGKFMNCAQWTEPAYIFTCDDDIIFPADYADKCIAAIEKYGRKAVISSHGRTYRKPFEIQDYYRDLLEFHGFTQHNPSDAFMHMLGTGVMAFHTDTIKFDLTIFPNINDTDCLFSAHCVKMGIPRVVIAHPASWLKASNRSSDSSISGYFIRNHQQKTAHANTIPWEVHVCAPVL